MAIRHSDDAVVIGFHAPVGGEATKKRGTVSGHGTLARLHGDRLACFS
jgi:hypothetical protein